VLILLGVLSLTGVSRRVAEAFTPGHPDAASGHGHPHSHAHTHSDYVHSHPHGHDPEAHGHAEGQTPLSRLDRIFGRLGVYQAVRPLVVGLVHGLAGSAAVALLILATIRDPLYAVGYLVVFGVGTIVGMMLITVVIALPFAYSAARFSTVNRYLGVAAGLLSLGVGLFLAYQIGLVDGLFTGRPNWTPK